MKVTVNITTSENQKISFVTKAKDIRKAAYRFLLRNRIYDNFGYTLSN